jgi:bifunctional DNase/RNase
MAKHAIVALALLMTLGCDQHGDASRDVPVRVSLVALDEGNLPILVLEEESGARMLPISIGVAEASSIDAQIHNLRPARPNSHDFAARLIAGLDGQIRRAVITEIRDGTFYAVLELEAHGKRVDIDARPSDAIATALRTGAPILVREKVFEEAGEEPVTDDRRRSISWPTPPARAPATRLVEL